MRSVQRRLFVTPGASLRVCRLCSSSAAGSTSTAGPSSSAVPNCQGSLKPDQQCEAATAGTEKFEEGLWPDCDTPEDIMEEERHGDPDVEPEELSQEVLAAQEALPFTVDASASATQLAARALLVGTVLAFAGCAAFVVAALLVLQETPRSVMEQLRRRDERDIAALQEQHGEVTVMRLDLSDPSTMVTHVMQLWSTLLSLSEDDDEESEPSAQR